MSEGKDDIEVKIVVDEGSTTNPNLIPDEEETTKEADEEDEHTEAQTDAEAD